MEKKEFFKNSKFSKSLLIACIITKRKRNYFFFSFLFFFFFFFSHSCKVDTYPLKMTNENIKFRTLSLTIFITFLLIILWVQTTSKEVSGKLFTLLPFTIDLDHGL